MQRKTYFVDVILPLPLPNLYTYRVPQEFNDTVERGKRVVVQFGRTRIYTAIIERIHESPPKKYVAKYILTILDSRPVINSLQFDHWKWLSSYYMCTIGEVMNAALPAGLKLESETRIELSSEYSGDNMIINDKEFLIVEALELHGTLTVKEVIRILGQKTVFHYVRSLVEKGIVEIREELIQKYKPKIVTYVKLAKDADDEDALKDIFNKLEKAPKQQELLMSYITSSKRYTDKTVEVSRPDLLKSTGAPSSAVNALVKKEVFELYEKEIGRLSNKSCKHIKETVNVELSSVQEEAYGKIKNLFKKKDVVLLHGVTSSGKTQIYIKLIKETIRKGKRVLYLLPEIALTTQIINRLRVHFGDRIGVYHSKFSDNERVEIWNSVMGGSGAKEMKGSGNSMKHLSKAESIEYDIVLGARSAIFLPFDNLGLVIVDEEHENTYKQIDPSPRYHARDSIIYLSRLHGAKTLLGSATPAVETYWNAMSGKYGLVELMSRYGKVQMPEILLVDLKAETRKNRMKSHFSPLLMELAKESLSQSKQIILFQNRRGFSSFLECGECNWIPHCTNCDVMLTYHKQMNRLTCHYCGYGRKVPGKCDACGSTNILTRGFGTEKIEEELPVFLPGARIARMDLDTTRSKYSYQRIINDFETGKIDILVGTQMVTKGLDFDNVSIVGILNADNMLNYPDFRSFERSFQLMAQVSGRAGRKKKRGKVVIQSYDPGHSVIQNVVVNNYVGLYESEIGQRKKFKYPPFYRLIEITAKHKDFKVLNKAADELAGRLRRKFGKRVLGPEYPVIGRVRNLYLKKILIKLEKEVSVSKAKITLQETVDTFKMSSGFKQVRVLVDVDPM